MGTHNRTYIYFRHQSMKNHQRFQWASNLMGIDPKDRILEIGCGVGFGVEAIHPLITTGKITAIDRSQTAIARAARRNEGAVKQGKAEFQATDLLFISKPYRGFDKVFCFNINFFWTKSSLIRECDVIKSVMARQGTLHIFYGPVFRKEFAKIVDTVTKNLQDERFIVSETLYNNMLKCYYIGSKL